MVMAARMLSEIAVLQKVVMISFLIFFKNIKVSELQMLMQSANELLYLTSVNYSAS